ncbi:MAG: hypothetical protein A3E80_02000 [Chlamydiae bacterium RIFCSPHIGHO2_12_FULL_49_9]|nr:MAG: hypothetical protein A3E80_02000 [Chlamydiae bacterium RIFCSPHIGHO2_12_FULL_49_9]
MSIDPAQVPGLFPFKSSIENPPKERFRCEKIARSALSFPQMPFAPDAYIFFLSRRQISCVGDLQRMPFERYKFHDSGSLRFLNRCLEDYETAPKMIGLLMKNFGSNIRGQQNPREGECLNRLKDLSGKEILKTLTTKEQRKEFVSFLVGPINLGACQPDWVRVLSKMVKALLAMEIEEWESEMKAWGAIRTFFELYYWDGKVVKVGDQILRHAISKGGRFLRALSHVDHLPVQNWLVFKVGELLQKGEKSPPSDWIGALHSEKAYSFFCCCWRRDIFWECYARGVARQLDELRKADAACLLIEQMAECRILRLASECGIPFEKLRADLLIRLKSRLLRRLMREEKSHTIGETVGLFRWFLSWHPPKKKGTFIQQFKLLYKQAVEEKWPCERFAEIDYLIASAPGACPTNPASS